MPPLKFGPDIYSSYNWCRLNNSDGCTAVQNTAVSIVSPPTSISFNDNNSTTIFPGQTITGDMSVKDCFNDSSSCLADAYFLCQSSNCLDNYILDGPSSITLYDGTVNTGLTINITKLQESDAILSLLFVCRTTIRPLTVQLLLNVTLLSSCPLGLELDISTSGQCECSNRDDENFICSKDVGVSCVRKGYWYGDNGTTRCVHLFCNFSGDIYPSEVSPDSANYLLLGSSLNDQCLYGHGGTLCTGCAHNKLPTYGALQCIDSDKCAKWQPYILLLLNIVIPFIDVVFLIAIIKLKLSIGSGYLYGPLFYLAVLNLIPLTSYSRLTTIVSSFVATLLLQFEILGYIPWCFFESVNLLTSKWLEFIIAPSVLVTVLSMTVLLARWCPKLLGRIQKSLLQAMCLVMYVLFWSLASTAISVITPVYLSGVSGARVHLQPDMLYLSGGHILLWIISVVMLLVFYSLVIVLTFSCFLNLHKLKPVFDEFQSCYRDSFRWYGGVYFIMWTILQIIILTSSYEFFQTLIIILTVTHCLLQPYSKKWLNVMDGFFLGSLSVTSCLVLNSSSLIPDTTKVIVHLAVLGSLCLIVIGMGAIVVIRFDINSKLINVARKVVSVNRDQEIVATPQSRPVSANVTKSIVTLDELTAESIDNDREPLVYFLQEDVGDS